MRAQKIIYPVTAKDTQSDNYFGTVINDPYRWLEDDTSHRTGEWVKEQNKVTADYLEKIPFRKKIQERLTTLWNYPKYGAPQKEGDWFTFYKNDGLQNQSLLYVQKGLDGKAEVLIDPNKLSADGTIALQSTAFSKKQRYFAYAVSASGSDWQEIYIMDFSVRKLTGEKITNVKFTGISWLDEDGFYYSGYDKPADEKKKFSNKTEFQKIFYHKIGTPQTADKLIYEDKDHPLRYVSAGVTEDGRFLVLYISEGTDGVEIKVKNLQAPGPGFVTIVPGFTTNASVVENTGDKLLLLTNEDAPNYKLALLDPASPSKESWRTIIPEAPQLLEAVGTGGGKIFASYLKDAATVIKQYGMDGRPEHDIQLPGPGTASGFGSRREDDFFFYTYTSFTYPSTTFRYDIKTGQSTLFRRSEVTFDPGAYETKQVFYPGKDGTQIPMFITCKKGLKLDGNNPAMLYAYGGFNINLTPAFSVTIMPFLEMGGVYCVANLRGGGEYGESWHKAGMLEKKQNVFDDFISGAEWLITEKYTSPAKLAIRGGSNGGLLVGACMTQRPELFAVALPQVGVLDMLRYHKFTVGWGWAVEYGSSDHKEQFEYLIKYSPLHNLHKGTCYPATLITTADHDDRVVPAHSFKFAAALQDAQGCDAPALIRIESKAGHGAGKPTSKLIEEAADIWSFVLYNMGVEY